ncbi:MAG: LamG domain-containing protein [Verrucomicrobiota bacterium]
MKTFLFMVLLFPICAMGAALQFNPDSSCISEEAKTIFYTGERGDDNGSVCAWVKLSNTNKFSFLSFGGHFKGHYWANWKIAISPSLRLHLRCVDGRNVLYAGKTESTVPLDEWHHIAVTVDKRKGKTLYIDGKPQRVRWKPRFSSFKNHSMAAKLIVNDSPQFSVGASNSEGNTAAMADIRCYNVGLKPQDIGQIFRGQGKDDIKEGLLARWVGVDEVEPGESVPEFTIVKDVSGEGNDLVTQGQVSAVESVLDMPLPDYTKKSTVKVKLKPPKPILPPPSTDPAAPTGTDPGLPNDPGELFPGEVTADPPVVEKNRN